MAPQKKRAKDQESDSEKKDKTEKDPKKDKQPTKKAKLEPQEEPASGDGKGEQIADKRELDKMYQAMKYMNAKGASHPLQHYQKLTSRKEKTEFYAKYFKDKKFDFAKVEEDMELSKSADNKGFNGWMTRFQIAHHEKLPVDSPLLVSKLASLPSRAHPLQEWQDQGEMEYFYTSGQIQNTSEMMRHSLKVHASGTASQKQVDQLMQGFPPSSSGPPKAIEDGPAGEQEAGSEVKGEEAEEEDEDEKTKALQETWTELKGKLQKTTKAMGDLCMEAQTIQGALRHRPHLEGLVNEVKKNLHTLEPQKVLALEALGQMNTVSLDDNKVVAEKIQDFEKLHEDCLVHIEGFKKGAFKEARSLLKSMRTMVATCSETYGGNPLQHASGMTASCSLQVT